MLNCNPPQSTFNDPVTWVSIDSCKARLGLTSVWTIALVDQVVKPWVTQLHCTLLVAVPDLFGRDETKRVVRHNFFSWGYNMYESFHQLSLLITAVARVCCMADQSSHTRVGTVLLYRLWFVVRIVQTTYLHGAPVLCQQTSCSKRCSWCNIGSKGALARWGISLESLINTES